MLDVNAIAGMITGVKAAAELVQLAISARDVEVVRKKAIELRGEILAVQSIALEAQAEQFALQNQVRELEKEVADLKAWDAEREKYQLANVREGSDGGGAFAYVLKDDVGSTEPKHFICPNCYQQGQKSILQEELRTPGAVNVLYCQRCFGEINRTGVTYTNLPRPQPPRRPRS